MKRKAIGSDSGRVIDGRRKASASAGLSIRSGVRAGTPSIPIPPPGPGGFWH